jgi:hypothetical protein
MHYKSNYKNKTTRNVLILMVLLTVILSCKEAVETKFNKDGVSVTCPKGWKIMEEGNIDGQGYYVSMEKDGFNSSGLFALSWINDTTDLEEYLDIYVDEVKNNIIYKNSSLHFGRKHKSKFNEINTLTVEFTSNIIGVKHQGIIHVLYGKGKTIAIFKQEAIEDKKKNMHGFKMIEQSFVID